MNEKMFATKHNSLRHISILKNTAEEYGTSCTSYNLQTDSIKCLVHF